MIRDTVLVIWFVLVGVAFFGPYAGLPAPVPALGTVYACLLLGGVVLALWSARRQTLRGATEKKGGEDGV